MKRVLGYSDSGARTRVDVRRVPGTAGLPGYLVFITMDVIYAAKYRVVISLKLTSRRSLSLLLCCTYLQYLGPRYFIENARTYVFLHDFTYEIHEKRTGWQPCIIS